MTGLAAKHSEKKTVMIDATYLKAHRTATSMGVKRRANDQRGRLIGRTKGVMNTKLHAIRDSKGRPLDLFVTAGQVSDYIGPGALLKGLPQVEWLLGDRGYDADWFREGLKDRGIYACMPGRKQRKVSVKYDKRRYISRNRIEIMFGRLNLNRHPRLALTQFWCSVWRLLFK